jgi:hypothetical protein
MMLTLGQQSIRVFSQSLRTFLVDAYIVPFPPFSLPCTSPLPAIDLSTILRLAQLLSDQYQGYGFARPRRPLMSVLSFAPRQKRTWQMHTSR